MTTECTLFVAVYDCLFVPERSLSADTFTRGFQDIHFSSGTLWKNKRERKLKGRSYCEGTQNRQLVHFKSQKRIERGLPEGSETQLMEKVLTALGRRSHGACDTKRQPSWDSPRRVLGPRCIREPTPASHASAILPTLCTEVLQMSTVLWDYIQSYLCLICYHVWPLGILEKKEKNK